MKPGDFISEARAKIIWGEPSSSVHDFLTSNGISNNDADAAIKEFIAERNKEIRKIGIKKTFIGAALIVGAGIFFAYVDIGRRMNPGSGRVFVTIAILIALGGMYGLWKLIDGINYLVRPQSERKSISDISK